MNAAEPTLVDARGMRCPWPALRLARAMRGNAAATLWSDDPRAADEVAELARQQGWSISVNQVDAAVRIDVARSP